MKFSQRIGKQIVKIELEKEGLSPDLKNLLWSAISEEMFINNVSEDIYSGRKGIDTKGVLPYFRSLWLNFFKYPIDTLPLLDGSLHFEKAYNMVREWYFNAKWFEVLDFVEFFAEYSIILQDICNRYLQIEMSAYRFIDGILVEVNSEEEIVEIKKAILIKDRFKPVKQHLKRAMELYSDRKNPDYRNSIKESISAIEAISKIILGNQSSTKLGTALREIEKKHNIHPALKSAFNSLYGYASDEGGIRHSLDDKSVDIKMEEARYMLVSCSAFVNYLISKL